MKNSFTLTLMTLIFVLNIMNCSLTDNTTNAQPENDVILIREYALKYESNLAYIDIREPSFAVKHISFTLIGPNMPSKIDVRLLRPENVNIPKINPKNIYQIIDIQPNNRDSKIVWTNIEFNVDSKWLKNNSSDVNDIQILQIDSSMATFNCNLVASTQEFNTYEVTLPNISTIAILTTNNPSLPKGTNENQTNKELSTQSVSENNTATSNNKIPDLKEPVGTSKPNSNSGVIEKNSLPTPKNQTSNNKTEVNYTPTPITNSLPLNISATPTPFSTMIIAPPKIPTVTLTPAKTPTINKKTPTPISQGLFTATPTLVTVTPTPTPTPTPTSISRLPTATPTATVVVWAILRPTYTPTPTFTPTATYTPVNTPTPTPTPTSTPTPLPGNNLYGVVTHNDNPYFLNNLGVRWYLNFTTNSHEIIPGAEKVLFVKTDSTSNLLPKNEIKSIINSGYTGGYWYIGGEPNVPLTYVSPETYADIFHYYYYAIKQNDPLAKITGPSILNWDFQCFGCGGYTTGEIWLNQFINNYETKYGFKPPVDIWGIDIYPIDWQHTPNQDPSQLAYYKGEFVTHSTIAIDQIKQFRNFLTTIPEYQSTPIWITEIALHVGFEGWDWIDKETGSSCTTYEEIAGGGCTIKPVGEYNWVFMADYLIKILNWLETKQDAYNITKWFFFHTWQDIFNPRSDGGYMGLVFFDDGNTGAKLTCLGEIYKSYSLNDSSSKPNTRCNSRGETIYE